MQGCVPAAADLVSTGGWAERGSEAGQAEGGWGFRGPALTLGSGPRGDPSPSPGGSSREWDKGRRAGEGGSLTSREPWEVQGSAPLVPDESGQAVPDGEAACVHPQFQYLSCLDKHCAFPRARPGLSPAVPVA